MQYSQSQTTITKLAQAERRIASNPEIIGLQSYEYLLNNAARLCVQFQGDDQAQTNPPLYYPRIAAPLLTRLAVQAQQALDELNSAPRSTRTTMLKKAVEVRLLELNMLQLGAMLQDDSLQGEERTEAQDWFRAANELIYGAPKLSLFATIADQRVYNLMRQSFGAESYAAQLQKELRQKIGPRILPKAASRTTLFRPQDVPPQVSGIIRMRFDPLVQHIQRDNIYTFPHILRAFKTALRKVGADALGWGVEEVEGRSHLAVSAYRKMIEVGEDRDEMIGAELQAKVVHEIGVHVLRSINAERAGWISAAYGQEGYLDFEESFAHVCGSVYWRAGNHQVYDEYRYLIAGFAYGMDARAPRNFRQCYEIIWRVMALAAVGPRGALAGDHLAQIRQNAYKQTVRMFRGTPGNVPGLLYLKDLAYIHGKEAVGRVVPLITSVEDMDLLLAGKLDLNRKDHLKVARTIAPGTPLSGALFATMSI